MPQLPGEGGGGDLGRWGAPALPHVAMFLQKGCRGTLIWEPPRGGWGVQRCGAAPIGCSVRGKGSGSHNLVQGWWWPGLTSGMGCLSLYAARRAFVGNPHLHTPSCKAAICAVSAFLGKAEPSS